MLRSSQIIDVSDRGQLLRKMMFHPLVRENKSKDLPKIMNF